MSNLLSIKISSVQCLPWQEWTECTSNLRWNYAILCDRRTQLAKTLLVWSVTANIHLSSLSQKKCQAAGNAVVIKNLNHKRYTYSILYIFVCLLYHRSLISSGLLLIFYLQCTWNCTHQAICMAVIAVAWILIFKWVFFQILAYKCWRNMF
jgi:hypothetical protein